MTESNKKMQRWKRKWVWVETTTGLSCIDVESIIAISHSTALHTNLDLHFSSGTIFTIKLADIGSITDELPDWQGGYVG